MKMSSIHRWLFIFACNVAAPIIYAGEVCTDRLPITTPYGDLVRRTCHEGEKNLTSEILLSGKAVIKAKSLLDEGRNNKKSVWIYSGEWNGRNAIFLLDISQNPIKAFAFGITMATNEIDYVSWGKKNDVIAIKNNVKFLYQGGRLIPPDADYAASHSITDTRNLRFDMKGNVIATFDINKNIPFVEVIESANK
jgi:hypothetical protein